MKKSDLDDHDEPDPHEGIPREPGEPDPGLPEHLAGCAPCRDAGGALRLASQTLPGLAAPGGPPPALRARVIAAAVEPRVALRVVLACTFCRAPLAATDASAYCAECLAPHHAECFVTHARCAAPGCGGTRILTPREVAPPRRRTSRVLLGALAASVGVGVAALAANRRATTNDVDVVASTVVDVVAPVASPPQPPVAPQPPPVAPQPPTVISAPARPPADTTVGTKLRVLYVEGVERPEWRHLRELLRHPLEVETTFVELARGEGRPPPRALELLDATDVVILGDVDLDLLPAGWPLQLAGRVRAGAGLIVLSGPEHVPAELGGTPLEDLLPVSPRRAPGATPAQRHEVVPASTDASLEVLGDLRASWPSLQVSWVTSGPLRPGARVILEHAAVTWQGTDERLALAATLDVERGRCVWVGFDEAWRLRDRIDGVMEWTRLYEALLEHAAPRPHAALVHGGRELRGRASLREAPDGPWLDLTALRTSSARLRDVVSLELGESAEPGEYRLDLQLANGDRLLIGGDLAGTERLTAAVPELGRIDVALDEVSALAAPGHAPRTDEPSGEDVLVVRSGGLLTGRVARIDDREVELVTDLGTLRVSLVEVLRLELASLGRRDPVACRAPVRLITRRGQRLCGDLISLDRDELVLRPAWSAIDLHVAMRDVQRLEPLAALPR